MDFLGKSLPFLHFFVFIFFIYIWIFRSSMAFPFVCMAILCMLKELTTIKKTFNAITILVDKRSKKVKNDQDFALSADYVVIDLHAQSRGGITIASRTENVYKNLPYMRFETSNSSCVNFPAEKWSNAEEEKASLRGGTSQTVFKDEPTLEPSEGNECSYQGEITKGLYHGYGVERSGQRTYKGQFWEGLWHGFGACHAQHGDRYEGTWRYGLKDGTGQEFSSDGTLYTGQFKNGTRHGLGWTRLSHGDWYAGEHKNGQMHGFGAYHFFNGDVYEGTWNNGDMHGYGYYMHVTGESKSGIWEHNVLRDPIPESHWHMTRTNELVRFSALNSFLVNKVDKEVWAATMQAEKAAACMNISSHDHFSDEASQFMMFDDYSDLMF